MSVTLKSPKQYWEKFSVYQSFQTAKELTDTIKRFLQLYSVTPSIKAVLNTLKLYSKRTFYGVSWLYIDEIAKKTKLSRSSVKRAIKELKAVGLLTVYENMHTEKGGKTHNVYVINPIFELSDEPSNEPSVSGQEEPETPATPTVCESEVRPYKNPHTNSNKNLKDLSIKLDDISSMDETKYLKHVPNEFIDLLEPFYGHSPKIIRDRWKTVCSAVKRSCVEFKFTSFDTIGQAWKDVVTNLKRGKIKDATDDGIGGYFYGVLCDYLTNDFFRNAAGPNN